MEGVVTHTSFGIVSTDLFRRVYGLLRGMVTPFESLRVTESQVPKTFFSAILPGAMCIKAVDHLLGVVQTRRVLKVGSSASEWQLEVRKRVTRSITFVKVMNEDAWILGYKGLKEVELVE